MRTQLLKLLTLSFLVVGISPQFADAGVNTKKSKLATQVLGGPISGMVETFGISKSGRYMVFASAAQGVVPGVDPAGKFQIFWLDRKTGATKIVSHNASDQVADDHCSESRVSDDGKRVVFLTRASNLGFASNGEEQVYYADLETGDVTLISKAPNGPPGSERAWYPDISGDGLVVTFTDASPNMLPFLTPHMHVFVYDSKTATLEIESVNNDGHFANDICLVSHLSEDGRYVVFESLATNFPDDAAMFGGRKIILRDREAQLTSIVSKPQFGSFANGSSYSASISENGRFVAFLSDATNLTSAADELNTTDVFVADLSNGKVVRMPGQFDPAIDEFALGTTISNDGRRVSVSSTYKQLANPEALFARAHVYDRKKKSHSVIQAAKPDVTLPADDIEDLVLSRSGRKAFFLSRSQKLDIQGSASDQVFQLALKGL